MIRTALSNPYLVIVGGLAVTVLGAFSYTKIPADLLPQFETSVVQIVCFYPGMPIELIQAIRARTDAQNAYSSSISDYNRAQFRLFHAIGQMPAVALEQSENGN